MSLIEIENVSYRYPTRDAAVLSRVSLKVEAGEYVVLAGASGSGKSTLLRLLNGLIPHFYEGHFEGIVKIAGQDSRERRVFEMLPSVGLVFQNSETQLFASSVERELAYGLESLGVAQEEIHARVRQAAETMSITPLLNRSPHSLSGGEQQRVAIAAMLVLRPRVLALDEPFTNLDPEAAENLREILRAIHHGGTTILVAEHRLSEVIADATRLVILNQGRVAIDETPRRALHYDLTAYHLNLPPLIRYARASGIDETPLTIAEGLRCGIASSPLQLFPSTSGNVIMRVRNLDFDFEKQPALRDVNFEIQRGQVVALIGKNGSGKTTLLKHLNALRRPTRGQVIVLGMDTRHARVADLAAQVGFVFQNPNDQLFKLSVREEVAIGAQALKRYDARALEWVYHAFQLQDLLERSPFRLSEGEKKRVAFASALAAQPEIIVLDEPTVGQDAAARDALANWIRTSDRTIVLATHDLEFAERVAPRWIALAEGRVVADGTPDAVMADASAMARAALRPTVRFVLQRVQTPPSQVEVVV